MGLVIRKKVSLDFLGDEYKDAYLTFKAIPVTELQSVLDKMPKEDEPDDKKFDSIGIMIEVLKTYFLDGKFPNDKGELEDVTQDDIGNIDADTAIHCFQGLSGVESNLDQESRSSSAPSTLTESPEATPPSNT